MRLVLESAETATERTTERTTGRTTESASSAWAAVVSASSSAVVAGTAAVSAAAAVIPHEGVGVGEPPPAASALACLTELMDSAPGCRNAFRHLAAVELGLQGGGGANNDGLFLFDLSAEHLKQALRQLDGLWMEPAPPPLAALRAKMADGLAAQEQRVLEVAQSRGSFNVLSSFMVDEKMQVSEGRASDFHQLSDSWGDPTLAPVQR